MRKTRPVAILVHGVFMHGLTMRPLARKLEQLGYHSIIFYYSSLRRSPAANARFLKTLVEQTAADFLLDNDPVHYLAHSLGGLIVRHLMAAYADSLPPGRTVTLGTPHQGSRVAQALCRHHLSFVLGQSIQQGLLGDLPAWPAGREIGSLAGSYNIGAGRAITRLAKPHDGTVALAETQFSQMSDQVCLPINHTSMMFSDAVVQQADNFFRFGHFLHDI